MKNNIGIACLMAFVTIIFLSSCDILFVDDEGPELASDAEKATGTWVALLTELSNQATQTAGAQLTEQARQASETEYAHQLTEEPRLLSVGNSRLVTVIEDPKDDCLDNTGHPSTACTFDIELVVIALIQSEEQLAQVHLEAEAAGIDSLPAFSGTFPYILVHLNFAPGWDPYTGYVCIDWLWAWVQEEAPVVESSGDVATTCYQAGNVTWVMHHSEDGELDQEANPPGSHALHDNRGMTFVQYYKSIYGNEGERQAIARIFGTAIDVSNHDAVDFQYSNISPPD